MIQGIGSTAVSQSYEMLGAALAKTQQKQEGKMVMQMLQAATAAAPAPQTSGSLGQTINILV